MEEASLRWSEGRTEAFDAGELSSGEVDSVSAAKRARQV